MSDIPFMPQITDFANGRAIGLTTEPGSVAMLTKTGTISLTYDSGAVVLADGKGKSIAGPVDMPAALQVAREVIEGQPRIITDPVAIYLLAACLLSLFATMTETRRSVSH